MDVSQPRGGGLAYIADKHQIRHLKTSPSHPSPTTSCDFPVTSCQRPSVIRGERLRGSTSSVRPSSPPRTTDESHHFLWLLLLKELQFSGPLKVSSLLLPAPLPSALRFRGFGLSARLFSSLHTATPTQHLSGGQRNQHLFGTGSTIALTHLNAVPVCS